MPMIQKVVPADAPIDSGSRVLVRLGEACNHACPMCTNSGAPDRWTVATEDLVRRVDFVVERGFESVVLTGGEPTIHQGFWTVVARLERHAVRWDVLTHGRSFRRPDFAARARAAGLERAIVSLHGHTPALAGQMSGAPPAAFEQTVAGVQQLLAAGVEVTLNLVLSKLNVDHLRAYLEVVAQRFDGQPTVKLAFPSLAGKGGSWGAIQLRLADLQATLRQVPTWAAALGVRVCYQAIPNCITGDPALDNMARVGFGETHYLDDVRGDTLYSMVHVEAALNVYAESCQRCAAFSRCPGLERAYAERHGFAELVPIPAPDRPWFL